MKKTHSINLAGRAFYIDEDAYLLFEDFLASITQEGGEAADVKAWEQKLAESALAKLGSQQQVIDLEIAERILDELKSPEANDGKQQEAYAEQSEEEKAGKRYYAEYQPADEPQRGEKRFYRDTDNGMLCGVCSGLAAYTGWNLTAIRVIVFIFTLTMNSSLWLIVLAYLALWMIVPPAITASQKLEMYGKPITPENIEQQVAADVSQHNRQGNAQLSSCMGCLLKGLLVSVAIGVFITIGLGLLSLAFSFLTGNSPEQFDTLLIWNGYSPRLINLSLIALLVVLILPFLILDKASWLSRQLRLNSSARWLLLMLWIACLAIVCLALIWLSGKLSFELYDWLHNIVIRIREFFHI